MRHIADHLWMASCLGRVCCCSSWQRLDLPGLCAILTADKSSHSAMDMLHRHDSAMCPICYTALAVLCPPSHKHTHNRFTALWILSGTTRVSQYQKKHSPPHTYHDHQSSLICFLHLLWSVGYSLFSLRAWQSFSTISVQVFFGLPLGLSPSTSYSIHFFTQSLSSFPSLPSKKKFAPSLIGDIYAQSSHWNSWWMKIAYNSAYVQIEMFTFTFAEQAIIVYVCLCSNYQEIAMPNAK